MSCVSLKVVCTRACASLSIYSGVKYFAVYGLMPSSHSTQAGGNPHGDHLFTRPLLPLLPLLSSSSPISPSLAPLFPLGVFIFIFITTKVAACMANSCVDSFIQRPHSRHSSPSRLHLLSILTDLAKWRRCAVRERRLHGGQTTSTCFAGRMAYRLAQPDL